jgi:hypothetical protein
MLFLIRRDETPNAAGWWAAVDAFDSSAPSLVRELRSSPSVAADPLEVQQAVAWARAHPAWFDDDPPLVAHDAVTG